MCPDHYRGFGTDLLARPLQESWGASVINRLAGDLRATFPGMTGLSARNLRYMRNFAEAYPDYAFVQQVAAQMPWGHTMALLDAIKGWPRPAMTPGIEVSCDADRPRRVKKA